MSKFEKVKSEIIQELLFDYVQLLGERYEKYFSFDSDMVNDDEMYIFLDKTKNREDYKYEDTYRYYLKLFDEKCEEFIKLLDKKLPSNLLFHEYFHVLNDFGTGQYNESCELHIWIKKNNFEED